MVDRFIEWLAAHPWRGGLTLSLAIVAMIVTIGLFDTGGLLQ